MAQDHRQLMELVRQATGLDEMKRILDMLRGLRDDKGLEKGDMSTLDQSIREVEVMVLEKEAIAKMNEIYETGYFANPFPDKDIVERLERHGGGWAGKIPCGSGAVLIHVVEAEIELHRTILRATHRHDRLRYRIQDQRVEPEANVMGFVCRVYFINMSDAPFSYDWTHYGCKPTFRFRSAVDGKYWVSAYPSGQGVGQALAEVSHLFDKVMTLGPGQTTERVFLFTGGTKYDKSAFFSDMVTCEYTVRYDFPEGALAPLEKRRQPPEVSFPLFKLEPPGDDGLARVIFEVHNTPDRYDRYRDTENYFVLPKNTMIVTKDKVKFFLDKYYLVPLSVDDDVIFRIKAEATAEKPGVAGNIKANAEWEIWGADHGWPTVQPRKVVVVNPDPATGGRDPPEVPPVVFEEPKEGEAAVVVKEEDMEDPVASYCQWLLTHQDVGYRRFSALRLGELRDERALEALIKGKEDKELEVALASQNAFKRITGMNIDAWLRKEKKAKEERERFRQIALQDARVVNVSIKDSVIQRSTISLKDIGEGWVDIKDSVVVRSDIGGDTRMVVDDVKVGGGKREEPKVEPFGGAQDNVDKYERALAQALADGVITPQEERLLKKLRERYGVSDDEHDILLAVLRDSKG